MQNTFLPESSSNAFHVWMGQWRLTTLDRAGSLFVLRFVLNAFRSRRPEDEFWSFLSQFLIEADELSLDGEDSETSRELLFRAGSLEPGEAQALMAYLSECYSGHQDRRFWNAVSDAIQLYQVAPYAGRSAGKA